MSKKYKKQHFNTVTIGEPKVVLSKTARQCPDCNSILSMYNSSDRCFSCTKKKFKEDRLNQV